MRLTRPRTTAEAPKRGRSPGRTSGVDRRSPSYCRVTFDHPPINTITATTVAELAELVELIEQDPDLNVVVFDSANPDFYLAHYDTEHDPARTAALGAGPTGMHAWLDLLVRLSRAPVGQHRVDPGPRPWRRKRVRARLRPAVRLARERGARPVRGRHGRGSRGRSDGPARAPRRSRPRTRDPARGRRPRRTARGAVRVRQPGHRRRPARRRGRRDRLAARALRSRAIARTKSTSTR